MIRIENLTKTFKKHTVLKNINLVVEDGKTTGLVGLNGIGKTTMVKTILDMMKPTEGQIFINNITNAKKESRENLYFLPEKFSPSQHLKGFEFVEIALSFYKKKFHFKKAQEMAEKLDLNPDVLMNQVGSYSKGMGQKLGLLSAFLSETTLLILDEPMSGLDPKSRIMLKNVIRDYMKSGDKTILFSSHILSDVDELCETLVILHDREIKYNADINQFKAQNNSDNLEKAFLNSITV